jgi:hypothetical protein
MTMHYTICHNDDDKNDPMHRRVSIEVTNDCEVILVDQDEGRLNAFEGFTFRNEEEAIEAVYQTWSNPLWDLRQESP